ncbi:S-adenosyl-L-methionine-dependent methyltransferase [Dacryopinax primogenitus]|uniref:S-adenosyl-L-methionine-dependent methyltransferase n=1 Tax=Dacryopinax primogenitus (strain DJM 731) TaxID=1858805 RepID=M5FVZ8_DACPD|nr:S-adenosyl-L-methionine-dependent methyltransferase [Dacryopinax primogenitus]EJT99809.1 S-adenosyl-L-methionine-dependent methyltransferase [Dacryopinax primogenitus]
MTAEHGTKYLLIHDGPEAERLNRQHERLEALFDHRLLPEGLELKADDRMLDSGTGTGIWVCEVASMPTVPETVHIDGIDITSHLFPISFPPNVHFSIENILHLPESAYSKYALNLFAALRPGGWLKMEEVRARIPETLPHSQRLMKLSLEVEHVRGIDFAAVDHFDTWLKEVGFEQVQVETKPWMLGPGETWKENRELLLGAWRAIRLGTMKAGGSYESNAFDHALIVAGHSFGISEEEWERFIRDLTQELEENEARMTIFSFTARKPVH